MSESKLTTTPNPGSNEALERGCKCAVLDNAHGKGYRGVEGVFVITGNCPLHGLGSDWGKPVEGDHP